MLYHFDWIVFFWIFSILVLFMTPLLSVSLGWCLRAFKGGKGMACSVVAQSGARGQVVEKRKAPRMKVSGVIVHVSDGIGYCEGRLHDVSQFGLCLENHINTFDRHTEKLGVLLIAYGRYFQVLVKPRWGQCDGTTECVGAEIEDAHWDWEDFRENLEAGRSVMHSHM